MSVDILGPSSATGHPFSSIRQDPRLRVNELAGNEDYSRDATTQEQMRALAPPRVDGAQEDERCGQSFEFCMEELYRILFQDEESPERECRLNALYKECAHYVRHTQLTSLSKECGRPRMRVACTGVGSFDSGTLQQPSDQVVDFVLPIDSLLHQHGARRDNAHPLSVAARSGCGHCRGARTEGDHMRFASIRRCSQGIGCDVLRTGFRQNAKGSSLSMELKS